MATHGLKHPFLLLAAIRRPPPTPWPNKSSKLFTLMKTSVSLFSVCALMGAALPAGAQPTDIRQGLVAYWPLESTGGGLAADATPFGNPLPIVGAPVVSAGKFNNAFTFDGSTTYLSSTHTFDNSATGLPIYRAGSYTIAMWVKGIPQTAKYLFTEGCTTNTGPLLLLQTGQVAANNSKFDIIIRPTTGAALVDHRVSATVVFDNTWHHIAWVDDRGNARLYVDGNLDPANFNYTPGGAFVFDTTSIGTLRRTTVSTGAIFNGQVDDVAVWERPLSQAEVQQVIANSIQTPIPEFPPAIFGQPAGATRQLQDRYTFSVRAVGNRPVTYQWYKGIDPIPGANSTSLSLSNLTPGDSGDYAVHVSNLDGTTVSSIATLTVLPDPPVNIRLGLVSHWPLDQVPTDDFGNTYTPDLYSQNNMGLTNSQGFGDQIAGIFGDAIVFNGVTQYGLRSGGFPIAGNTAYSVAMWVNANGTGQSDRRFFSESSTNSDTPLFGFGTHATGVDGTIRVYLRNESNNVLIARNTTRPALDGTWHHVVWTDNNGAARLYVDGALDETDFFYPRSSNIPFNQTALAAIVRGIGGTNIGSYFAGALDDVAVWSRALSYTDIQEIRLNGIPAPLGAIPPEVTQQPVSQSVLTGSRVTFTFAATGTSPLTTQWRKDGSNIPDQTGPSLFFNGVALTDAGGYDVVVVNAAGRATSQVAALTVTLRPPPPTDLRVDLNDTANDIPANTEAGFASFVIPSSGTGPFTKSFGGADVTLTAIGTTMQSRKRSAPTNASPFTQERLLQDFVFTSDADVSQGLDVAVEFMEPSTQYDVSIWSYDNSSVGANRISDWTANGVTVISGYTFFGSNLPVDNDTYRFAFTTTSDADGKILIQGRRSANATGAINVFLNALTVTKREIRVSKVENLGFELALTVQLLNPGATHSVVEKTNLTDADWTTVADAVFEPPIGNSQRVIIPIPASNTRFYRILEGP